MIIYVQSVSSIGTVWFWESTCSKSFGFKRQKVTCLEVACRVILLIAGIVMSDIPFRQRDERNVAALICYNSPGMDELDHRLIKELLGNAERSNAELSVKFGVSEKTVRRRMSHLIDNGVITRAIIPNPIKLGYDVRVFIALEVELSSLDNIIQSLTSCANVDFVALCAGQIDVLLGAWFHSSREMVNFVKDYLAKISGIRKTQTIVVLDIKQNKSAPIDLSPEGTNRIFGFKTTSR